MHEPLDDPRYAAARDILRPVWDQLGRVSDRLVAKEVGVPTTVVTRIRELARIGPSAAERLRFSKHVAPLVKAWPAVHELPDMTIAKRVGVRYSAVVLFRALHGHPPQAAPVEPWQGAVGLFPDEEIAERGRVPLGRVADHRRHLGLARTTTPYWSGPAAWADLGTATDQDLRALLEAARGLPQVPSIHATDARFRAWFESIGSSAATLAEALAAYPERPFIRAIYHLRALTERIAAYQAMSLDEEMRSLMACIFHEARRTAMLERFSLHGERRRGAASIAKEFRVTEAAVGYWMRRFEAATAERQWLPAFDRFLAAVEGGPRDDERLAALARAHGSAGRWSAFVVERVARYLKRSVSFHRAHMGTAASTLSHARHGPFTVERARETLENQGFDLTTERVLALVERMPDVEWVHGGPPDGWFWFPERAERSTLVYAMRKLVAVGPVAASEVVEGVTSRNRDGRERVEVPAEVAAAVAARLGLAVRGGVIDMPPDEDLPSLDVLTDVERAVVGAFERSGSPVLIRPEMSAACTAAGLGPTSLTGLMSSPLVRDAGRGRSVLRSHLRGRPPFTELRALAGLAIAMARPHVAVGIRVAGGTWSWKSLGDTVVEDMRALGRDAEALALVRPFGRGWSVVAERPGEVIEGWMPLGGPVLELGPIVRTEQPLWLTG